MKRPPALFPLLIALAVAPALSRAQQPPPVDPKADQVLRQMGATLAAAPALAFTAHATADQMLPDGQKVQYARNQKVRLRRPDRLAADVTGDTDAFSFRYDGRRVLLYNPRTNSWGEADAPATIDQMLDMLAQDYGLIMPLADLAFADPYQVLIENVRRGTYVGLGLVFDTRCHHLAFRQGAVDWQIWIEEGAKALPRKVVITFKDSPAHPQYTAFLSDWDLSPADGDETFVLKPPAGAKKVEFAPATQPAPQPATQPAATP